MSLWFNETYHSSLLMCIHMHLQIGIVWEELIANPTVEFLLTIVHLHMDILEILIVQLVTDVAEKFLADSVVDLLYSGHLMLGCIFECLHFNRIVHARVQPE